MAGEPLFRVLFAALFSCLTLVRLYFRVKARVSWERLTSPAERFPLLIAQAGLGIPLMAASASYLVFQEGWGWAYLVLPAEIRWAGVPLGAAALGLLVWAHRALGNNFSTGIHLRPGHKLVRRGPYRLVRHPIYSAYGVLFLSGFLLSRNWIIGSSGLAIIALLMTFRLRMEEDRLASRFGATFEFYRRVTPKFIPRLLRRPRPSGAERPLRALNSLADTCSREPPLATAWPTDYDRHSNI